MKYLLILALFISPAVLAWGGHYESVNNYYTENNYEDSGVSSSELDSDVAAIMAADAIHCTTSTRKKQMGVGMGYRSGKNGYAIGGCQTLNNDGTPVMLGIKAAGSTGRSPTYSVGVNWTF